MLDLCFFSIVHGFLEIIDAILAGDGQRACGNVEGIAAVCCLRWGYACGEETDEKCQREQRAQNFSAEFTHGRRPLSCCAETRKTDARWARRCHARDASVK